MRCSVLFLPLSSRRKSCCVSAISRDYNCNIKILYFTVKNDAKNLRDSRAPTNGIRDCGLAAAPRIDFFVLAMPHSLLLICLVASLADCNIIVDRHANSQQEATDCKLSLITFSLQQYRRSHNIMSKPFDYSKWDNVSVMKLQRGRDPVAWLCPEVSSSKLL